VPLDRLVIARCGDQPVAFPADQVRRLEAEPSAPSATGEADPGMLALPIEDLFRRLPELLMSADGRVEFGFDTATPQAKRRAVALVYRGKELLILVDEPVTQYRIPAADLYALPELLRDRPETTIIAAIARIEAADGPLLIPVVDVTRVTMDDALT
jgi:hypothetical protein